MILYIHPDTKIQFKCILPMSLPALINGLSETVKGRFHDEWTKEEVKAANIIIMDIHWYMSMRSAIKLSFQLKIINPEVTLIAGGISASVFWKYLLRDSALDYIIRGDGEVPLKMLVDTLKNGKDVSNVPNVCAKDFVSKKIYTLTSDDMNRLNYRNISFFPSLKRKISYFHNGSNEMIYDIYPFLMVYRGCSYDCEQCCGSPEIQQSIFFRSRVIRSSEKVKEDLVAWSQDPDIRFVNIHHDLVSLPFEYVKNVLTQKYDLYVLWDMVRIPSEQSLSLMLNSFKGGELSFCLDAKHNTSEEIVDVDMLIKRIKQAQKGEKYKVILRYSNQSAHNNLHYKAALLRIKKITGCAICNAESWWQNDFIPGADGLCSERQYQKCLRDTNKYVFGNFMYNIGVRINMRIPRLAKWVGKIISYRP